mmetsp:Transcript_9151/g.14894  ORF Transcript_9151/g.14894 Transcript_9151/m.14894 type:complete len:118 (-) Transcript_9151:727-1080(-)
MVVVWIASAVSRALSPPKPAISTIAATQCRRADYQCSRIQSIIVHLDPSTDGIDIVSVCGCCLHGCNAVGIPGVAQSCTTPNGSANPCRPLEMDAMCHVLRMFPSFRSLRVKLHIHN